MSRVLRTILAVVATTIATAGLLGALPSAATAAPGQAVLGGGSGIVIQNARCTLTSIGFDGAGRLVGLTAGHCARPGDTVVAESARGLGPVGTVAVTNLWWDYAVIQFDAGKVVPVRDVGGMTINGVGPDPGVFQTVCKNGRTTGLTCGIVWGREGDQTLNHTCADHGDSGAPVAFGDRLVGMTNGGRKLEIGAWAKDFPCSGPSNPFHTPVLTTSITDILGVINSGGGVGAGFRPI